jgi:integrase
MAAKLNLGELCRRFFAESANYLDNASRTKKDAEARTKVLIAFFGAAYDVATLTQNDVDAYSRSRLRGGIVCDDGTPTSPVRARSVEADLDVLRAMIRWAMTVRVPTGGRLILFDPLVGVRRVREKNPRQPIASPERFAATRIAMQSLAVEAHSVDERTRWLKMELALVLAEATGRRLGSIRQLRWEDIDLSKHHIRWRAEADKKGKEWVIPTPLALSAEIESFRRRLCAEGGLIFAGLRTLERPMDRHLFDKWLGVAERKAALPKLVGGMWHPYRRKWATERKHHPLKDVAAAGGWNDTDTLVKVYQQADPQTLLAVMSNPRRLPESLAAA